MKKIDVFKEVAEYLGREYGFELIDLSPKKFILKKEDKKITFGPGIKNNDVSFYGYDVDDEDDMVSYAKDIVAALTNRWVTECDMKYVISISQAENEEYMVCTDNDNILTVDTDERLRTIDTRAYNIHEFALDMFWGNGMYDSMCEEINRIANTTTVYTYKGKEFYIAPKITEIEFEYAYINEDGELEWDMTSDIFSERVDDDEVNKIESIIEEKKLELERISAPYIFEYEFKDSYLCEFIKDYIDIDDYFEEMEQIIKKEITDKDIHIENDGILNWFVELLKDRSVEVKDGELLFFGKKVVNVNNHKFMEFIDKCELKIKRTPLNNQTIKLPFNAFIYQNEEYHESWFELLDFTARNIMFYNNKHKKNISIELDSLFKAKGIKAIREIRDKLVKRLENKLKLEKLKEIVKNKKICLTFEDSLAAGNCKSGTREFVSYLSSKEIDVSVECIDANKLLEFSRQKDIPYVVKAIEYKINKQIKRINNETK
jgi:hypothetical protein